MLARADPCDPGPATAGTSQGRSFRAAGRAARGGGALEPRQWRRSPPPLVRGGGFGKPVRRRQMTFLTSPPARRQRLRPGGDPQAAAGAERFASVWARPPRGRGLRDSGYVATTRDFERCQPAARGQAGSRHPRPGTNPDARSLARRDARGSPLDVRAGEPDVVTCLEFAGDLVERQHTHGAAFANLPSPGSDRVREPPAPLTMM